MNETATISVIIADDHAMVRSTLRDRLAREGDLTLVGEAANAEEALELVARTLPDVIIMDIGMPGSDSFEAARSIRARSPRTAIVFMSAFCYDYYIERALHAGASGYVTKGERIDSLIHAIHAAARGENYFSPEVQARLVQEGRCVRFNGQRATRISLLSPRELQVLQYIAEGLSRKEIAHILHLSEKTVVNHSTNVMSKLDIHDRVELTRFAIREGVVRL